ncbi:MAG: replicative DNA helicase, partial [Butyricicoccaceae bacterium]
VREADFLDPACREIFRAARGLFLNGSALNAVTILHALGGDEGAYRKFFMELMEITPTAAGWKSYAEIMRQQARMHHLRDLGRQLAAAQTLDDAQELVSKISAAQISRTSCVHDLNAALLEFYNDLDRQPEYLTWGLDELDDGTIFAEQGDFIVIGARPSVGKTALALQFASHISQSKKVGFFSLETSAVKLTQRLIAAEADVSFGAIKRRSLTDDDYCAIASASNRASKRKLDLIDAGGMTVSDIRAVTLSRRYDVIFVDYLQIIQSRTKDTYQRVTQISIDLHTFAQQCGVTIIALAQLSRPERIKANGQQVEVAPRMGDLRESGQIEQDADVVMMLSLSDPNNMRSDRVLRIVKNKEGIRKKFNLKFVGDRQIFFNVPAAGDEQDLPVKVSQRPAKVTDPQMTLQMPNERRKAIC